MDFTFPLALCAVVLVVVLLVAVPVHVGARAVGAQNHGMLRCFVAALFATIAGTFVGKLTGFQGLAGLFVSALIYMLFLETTYLRGIVIALIQFVVVRLIAFAVMMTTWKAMFGSWL